MIKKYGLIAGIIVVALVVVFGLTHKTSLVGGTSIDPGSYTVFTKLGVTSNAIVQGNLAVDGTLTAGGGSALSFMKTGTCTLVSDASIAATSTGTGTCAITGAVAGDKVFLSLATTTTNMSSQYSIIGTVAGTNSVTVRLLNLTGTAAVPSATNGFGSSTAYWLAR